MEKEDQTQQYEEKLKQHDREIGRLNDEMLELQKTMNEGLNRIDESNHFLREQNIRQSEQNAEILKAVLKGSERAETNQHELKMLDKSNSWKLLFGIGGSAGVVFAFVMELLQFLGGK